MRAARLHAYGKPLGVDDVPRPNEPVIDRTHVDGGAANGRSPSPARGNDVEGKELFYAYMVDNQAIVIPETMDAIRALTGTVRAADASIVRTNTALGIDGALM